MRVERQEENLWIFKYFLVKVFNIIKVKKTVNDLLIEQQRNELMSWNNVKLKEKKQ